MTTSLTFVNNQNWLLVYNVSQWDALYDFTSSTLRMQIRREANDSVPIYSFGSAPNPGVRGTITYFPTTHLLLARASYADVRTYFPAGAYVHDMTIEVDDPLTGAQILVRDIAAGALTVTDGVTLR